MVQTDLKGCGLHHQAAMEDSQPSLSQRRQSDLDDAENSRPAIPFDLIVEIFSFLPGKSLIRFQSVSKLWLSTIRGTKFADSFLTRSKTRPRLLLPFMHFESRKLFILSAPEHNNKEDDKVSSIVIPRHDMTIDYPFYYIRSRPVNGLVCCICNSSIAVCNPTTRQIVKLPDVPLNGRCMYARLGYDPVEDQYKVLCVVLIFNPYIQHEYFVCTVKSSQKQEWRKVENTTGENYPSTVYEGICIDGAIYYGAGQSMIVRFDVGSEKMEFIKSPKESDFSTTYPCTLINYKGKLGGIDYANKRVMMRLWILEDAEKHEWSSMTRVLPSEFDCFPMSYLMSKDEIHTGELMVFHPQYWLSNQFCIWYYDFKKESIKRKVEIILDGDFKRIHGTDGIDEITDQRSTYPGYFENIRFL